MKREKILSIMKISLNEKIFVAGANGMVGSAVKRLLTKKGYGLKK